MIFLPTASYMLGLQACTTAPSYQKIFKPDMLGHACNPSIQETEAGRKKFESSLGHIVKPCLEKPRTGYVA
jgi:hypothetical protein